MKLELQKKLATNYPKIFKNVGGDPMVTCMAWGIECNDGWYDLLDTLCYTMQQHCDAKNTQYIPTTDNWESLTEADPGYMQVVAAQVKEKYGTLRFYVDGGDSSTDAMLELAEAMSGRICELCGSPAQRNTDSGWIHTICNACNLKRQANPNDSELSRWSQDVLKGVKQAKEGKFSNNQPQITPKKKTKCKP